MSFLEDLGKIVGGKSKKKGAKRARKAGEKAWQEARAMIEESTSQARADQAPYRQAGATALDALMSMTGLGVTNFGQQAAERAQYDIQSEQDARRITGDEYIQAFRQKLGRKGRKRADQYLALNPYQTGADDQAYIDAFAAQLGKKGSRRFGRFQDRNPYGGAIGRAYGGFTGAADFMDKAGVWRGAPEQRVYNVNEGGPENVFEGGAVTRNDQPQSITSDGGYVQPNENPGGMEGGYSFQTDPGYEFRMGEGMRALERGAAARGGLLSGGYARKAIRYGQDYASNEYQNVYNRIASIAGIGQGAAGAAGSYALQGGSMGANARGMEGAYRSSGYYAQGLHQGQNTENLGQVLSNYTNFDPLSSALDWGRRKWG